MSDENKSNAWEMLLSERERGILSEKIPLQENETPREAFNRIIFVSDNQEATEQNVIAIRNVADVLGGHKNSDVWIEVESIDRVYPDKNHLVQIYVKSRERFVDAMKREKDELGRARFAVNDFFDKTFAHHPNDSIRQRTEFATDYPIHLANDDSKNVRVYFIHFDPASPYFRTTTHDGTESFLGSLSGVEHLTEIKWAAEQHEKVFIVPSKIREHLRDTGQTSED
jgi:hypothetical protein